MLMKYNLIFFMATDVKTYQTLPGHISSKLFYCLTLLSFPTVSPSLILPHVSLRKYRSSNTIFPPPLLPAHLHLCPLSFLQQMKGSCSYQKPPSSYYSFSSASSVPVLNQHTNMLYIYYQKQSSPFTLFHFLILPHFLICTSQNFLSELSIVTLYFSYSLVSPFQLSLFSPFQRDCSC